MTGFSPLAIELANNPKFRGPLSGDTTYGLEGFIGEGPYFELWCRLSGETILEAAYRTYGCISSMAVGGALCTLLTGRSLDSAKQIDERDLRAIVGELPEGKGYCIALALGALREVKEKIDNVNQP